MEETKLLPLIMSLFLSLSASIATPVFASENLESVTTWLNNSQCQKEHYFEDAKQLKENAENHVRNLFSETDIDKNKTCSGATNQELDGDHIKNNKSRTILIFVSLSMPKDSLQKLYTEAESLSVPLIVRGLKNNSFKETAEVLKNLNISVEIDPNLFEEHEIKVVPTFVTINKNETLQIKGNISLSYAQIKFEEAL
jgi:conjugal transfer pilus assembly protein TrbC